MPTAAILGFDGCYASIAGGFADILQVANSHLRKQGADPAAYFDWHFLGHAGPAVRSSNGLELAVRPLPTRRRYDLVFVPSLHYAGHRDFDRFLQRQAPVCDWLNAQWQQGAWIVANCTGTFVLAASGLLDHRAATTTWWLEQQFRQRFPLVDLQMRPLVTEADRLVCGGAHASFLLQTVRVVERFSGPAIATRCARSMLIDVTQTTQTAFLPLLAEKNHQDLLIHRAQKYLQEHMADLVRMSDLAAELAVSERTLIRRFQAVLGQSPLTYLQHLRIDTARAMLEASDVPIERLAAYVGYADPSSFARLFRARVGLPPGAYRSRFNNAK
jgi:transcriptional regulator GlxA family with amidase domain